MSQWKNVGSNKGAKSQQQHRPNAHVELDVVTERYPNGYRTFPDLETLFTVVLAKKLRERYRTVRVTHTSADGETTHTGHQYKFVILTIAGPGNEARAACLEAERFLPTDRQPQEYYIQRMWAPTDAAPDVLRRMIARASLCADELGIHVNYSRAKSAFFVTSLLLDHELHTLRSTGGSPDSYARTMLTSVASFLSLTHNTFRSEPTSAPSPNGGHAPRGGRGGYGGDDRGGRGGGRRPEHSSPLTANPVSNRISEASQLPPAECKKYLAALYQELCRAKPADLFEWLMMCYSIEIEYIRADYAQNEINGLEFECASLETEMGVLVLNPNRGERPFTQRYPRISSDDPVRVRLPGTEKGKQVWREFDLRIYYVTDFKLSVHLGDHLSDPDLAHALSSGGLRVDITFDPMRHVSQRDGLRKNLANLKDSFDRIRGYGTWRDQSTDDIESLLKKMRSDPEFRRGGGGAVHMESTAPASSTGTAGRGRGSGGGVPVRAERGRGGRGAGAAPLPLRPAGSNGLDSDDDTDGDSIDAAASILDDLYDAQRVAAYALLNRTGKVVFIDGPGGTGKSEVLARSIALLRQRQPKSCILVVTPTVPSGDVIAHRIIRMFRKFGLHHELIEEEAAPNSAQGKRNAAPRRRIQHFLRHYGKYHSPLNSDSVLYDLSNAPLSHNGERIQFHALTHKDRFMELEEFFEHHDPANFNVVVCTPAASKNLPESFTNRITHLFLDEAGCTPIAASLVPISVVPATAQLVLAGDPQQLAPRTHCPFTKQDLQTNPLQFMSNALHIPLRVSHRSSSGLVGFQSYLFYDGKLQSAHEADRPADAEGGHSTTCYPRWSGHRGYPSDVRILHNAQPESRNQRHRSGSTEGDDAFNLINRREIELVDQIVRSLGSECDIGPKDIGIVCEYPEQQRELRQRLAMVGKKEVRVASIDDYQGNEREVMIAVLTRSTYDPKDRYAADLHSLCTTLTRAKSLAIIVGNVPVYLNRDLDKQRGRKAKGRWTMLVEHCLERRAIDGYDFETNEYGDATDIPVPTRIDVPEFVPQSLREIDAAKRTIVPREDVIKNPSHYFVGIVVGRTNQETVLVRNRFRSVLEVAVDEEVSSGHRAFAVMPGDVVAVTIDPTVRRWLPSGLVGAPATTVQLSRLSSGNLALNDHSHPADFINSLDVSSIVPGAMNNLDLRPTGTVACLLKRADVYPQAPLRGRVHGAHFFPSNPHYPPLPLHFEYNTPNISDGAEFDVHVQLVPDDKGVLRRKYTPSQLQSHVPLPRIGGFTAHEYSQILQHTPELDPAFCPLDLERRALRQPVGRITRLQMDEDGFALAEVTVVAPASGVLACVVSSGGGNDTGAVEEDRKNTCSATGYSRPAAVNFCNKGAYPLPVDTEDGMQLPMPSPKDLLLMVGVKFTVRYFARRFPAQPPKDYRGPVIVQAPSVVRYKRSGRKIEPVQGLHGEFELAAKAVLQRQDTPIDPTWWRPALLSLANHAAALLLLNKLPGGALLLRQSRALEDRTQLGVAPAAYDPPEWHVVSTATPDLSQYVLQTEHAPSGLVPMTSFTAPHHCFGDALVQHLLLCADGQRHQALETLLASLREHVTRLNAIAVQAPLL